MLPADRPPGLRHYRDGLPDRATPLSASARGSGAAAFAAASEPKEIGDTESKGGEHVTADDGAIKGLVRALADDVSPSAYGKPGSSSPKHDNFLRHHRPAERLADLPAQLVSRVFGVVTDYARGNDPACEAELHTVMRGTIELCNIACKSFVNEGKRRDAMNHQLSELLGVSIGPRKLVSNAETDGSAGDVSLPPVLNAEYKWELGQGSSDPTLQNAQYYRHFLKEYLGELQVKGTLGITAGNWPMLLLSVVGPYASLWGAAILQDSTGNWCAVVDPLTPFVPLMDLFHDRRFLLDVARLVLAMKKGAELLIKERKVEAGAVSRFPYPTSCEGRGDRARVVFQYNKVLQKDKLVFLATTTSGAPPTGETIVPAAGAGAASSTVVVKFINGPYPYEVHERCARVGHAPVLLGHERLPGGWTMIVMQFMEGRSVPVGRRDLVDTAVASMHDHRFVHGDLRAPNLLLVEPDGGAPFVVLLDFDSAGPTGGSTRYPMFMDITRGMYPSDAVAGGEITVDLDKAAVDMLNL